MQKLTLSEKSQDLNLRNGTDLTTLGTKKNEQDEARRISGMIRQRKYPVALQRKHHTRTHFGKITFVRSSCATQYRVTVCTPSWLSGFACDIEIRLATPSWQQLNVRQYNIRHQEAEVFSVIRKGDLPELLRLFSLREASPYDRDDRGWSLLHV